MKKLPLFILLQLSLICLFVGGLSLNNKSFTLLPIEEQIITIDSLKDSTLVITPNLKDPIDVHPGQHVGWLVPKFYALEYIRLTRKPRSAQIFTTDLMQQKGRYISGFVKNMALDGEIYNYNIVFKLKNKPERTLDPKLAVKSTSFRDLNSRVLILYGLLFVSIFGVFRSKKARAK